MGPLATALTLAALAVLWTVAARRVWLALHFRRHRTLAVVAAALATAMTVSWTPVREAINHAGTAYAAGLVKHTLGIVAFTAAVEFLTVTTPGAGPRRTAALRTAAATATAAMVALFVTSPRPAAPTPDLLTAGAHLPGVVAYGMVFLTYLAATLAAALVLLVRYTSAPQTTAPVRIGLRVTALGTGVGLVYTGVRTTALLGRFAGAQHLWVPPRGLVMVGLLSAALVLIAAGMVIPATPSALRWVWAYHSLRQLYPLWRDLHTASPEIALTRPRDALTDALPTGAVPARLYRRVIEIRDGLLALRGYAPAEVYTAAATRARAAGLGDVEAQAAGWACWIGTARRAKLAGSQPAEAGQAPPVMGESDLRGEVRWLSHVARAYRSPQARTATDRQEAGSPDRGVQRGVGAHQSAGDL